VQELRSSDGNGAHVVLDRHARYGGFSLLEILVVIAIVAVIAGMAVPVAAATITRSKVAETREEMRMLAPALQSYFWDCRRLPTTLSQLQTNSPAVSGWKGPYTAALVSSKPNVNLSLDQDAWNTAYVLSASVDTTTWSPTTSTNQIVIRSKGPDLTLNTSDDLSETVSVIPQRRKETVDELNIINTAIQAYNAQYLASAPLPTNLEAMFNLLYGANVLPRPPTGTTDTLRTDGWGSAYVATPSGVTPVVRVTSSNITGAATPPAGN